MFYLFFQISLSENGLIENLKGYRDLFYKFLLWQLSTQFLLKVLSGSLKQLVEKKFNHFVLYYKLERLYKTQMLDNHSVLFDSLKTLHSKKKFIHLLKLSNSRTLFSHRINYLNNFSYVS